VTWVGRGHHVLGIEHLLCQFGYREGTVLLAATRGEWGETDHEEMETRERHHVDGEFTQVSVQLTRETETCGDAGHDGGHEMVQVTVGRGREFERAEANVVQRLVVDTIGLVRVLHQLVHRQGGVVGLDDGVGDFGRWDDGEGAHHPVGELLTDLGDEQGAHTGTGATTE